QFQRQKHIHSGSDGSVSEWKHPSTGYVVAVKEPKPGRSHMLKKEFEVFELIPEHANIVQLFGCIEDWSPAAPALVLELAQTDLNEYRYMLLENELRVPEMTLWKLMRDVSSGLAWLHNHCSKPFVHGDIKPENILVFDPPNWDGKNLPLVPIFKICDIGRMKPATKGDFIQFDGTPEFGPPIDERASSQTPAVDMWSLGASIQWFALGFYPHMLMSDFVEYARQEFQVQLTEQDLKGEGYNKWRNHLPTMYRPLNASIEVQKDVLKLKSTVPPYSQILNSWYAKLFHQDASRRMRSKTLAKYFVPAADGQIKVLE
ncbi:kinase-like protein, partial [Bimuria novae-zelandiae CBS 107.79]